MSETQPPMPFDAAPPGVTSAAAPFLAPGPAPSGSPAAPVSSFARWFPKTIRWLAFFAVVGLFLAVGSDQFARRYALVKPIAFIGHADQAAYALDGESIARGQGFQNRFISEFFIPYSPDITRRDDHWPPFLPYCIAICFLIFGKAAWVAKLPVIFFGTIGLPLATAALAYALSRRGYVAIVAGLLMLIHSEMYLFSMVVLADLPNAALFVAFCACMVAARRRPWLLVLAGVFLAWAYFCKGSHLLLLPLFPIVALLCCGWRVLIRKHLYLGMGTALLLIAPFWYGNYRAYGDPLHSVQNYVSGYYGFQSWETGTYFPYWGHNLPRTSDRWTKYASAYPAETASNREYVVRYGITGSADSDETMWEDFGHFGTTFRNWLVRIPAAGGGEKSAVAPILYGMQPPTFPAATSPRPIAQWSDPSTELPAVGAALLLVVLLVTAPVVLVVRFLRWQKRQQLAKDARIAASTRLAPAEGMPPEMVAPPGVVATQNPGASGAASSSAAMQAAPVGGEWLLGPALALFLIMIAEAIFMAYCWDIHQQGSRFCYIFPPVLAALACTAASRFIEWPLAGIAFVVRQFMRLIRDDGQPPLANSGGATGAGGVASRFAVSHPAFAALFRSWSSVVTLLLAGTLLLRLPAVTTAIDGRIHKRVNNQVNNFLLQDEPEYPRVGAWIAANIPDAVIMARNPWQLAFHSAITNKTIGLPAPRLQGDAGADQILAIAHYYHVTHFYADNVRQQLAPYLNGQKPGFTRVAGPPGAPLYAIDWSKIPVKSPDEVCTGQ